MPIYGAFAYTQGFRHFPIRQPAEKFEHYDSRLFGIFLLQLLQGFIDQDDVVVRSRLRQLNVI